MPSIKKYWRWIWVPLTSILLLFIIGVMTSPVVTDLAPAAAGEIPVEISEALGGEELGLDLEALPEVGHEPAAPAVVSGIKKIVRELRKLIIEAAAAFTIILNLILLVRKVRQEKGRADLA